MNTTRIILPDTIYINKIIKNQVIFSMPEEFSIYFSNIIEPYSEDLNIQIKCKYGENLGNCWRISNFEEDTDEFDFEIFVYDNSDNLLASKKSRAVMVERKLHPDETNIITIGDSITFAGVYATHIQTKLINVKTRGSRSVNKTIFTEGRGGWVYRQYFEMKGKRDEMSPFIFPEGIDGEAYYGCMEFFEELKTENASSYPLIGFEYEPIKDGQYFLENQKLYLMKNNKKELICENPEFEFDFGKYLKRYSLENIDAVSLFLGANDLNPALCSPENYLEDSEKLIDTFMDYTKRAVESIHNADKNIKVIVSLPIHGGTQHSFGKRSGCACGEKVYRRIIIKAAERLIKEFDNRQDENIFICPLLMCVDPEYSWNHNYVKANLYSDHHLRVQTDGIHPNYTGYCQIGDALSAIIEHIR